MKLFSCAGRLWLRGGSGHEGASITSTSGTKRKPRPGMVATACAPSTLRSVEIWTCRLFSSTTRPGHARSKSSSLVDHAVAVVDQGEQDVEGARAEMGWPSFDQQQSLGGTDLHRAKTVRLRQPASPRARYGQKPTPRWYREATFSIF